MTVILSAFDDVVAASYILLHIAFHALKTESMAAPLFAVVPAQHIADVAQNLRSIDLSLPHVVFSFPGKGLQFNDSCPS